MTTANIFFSAYHAQVRLLPQICHSMYSTVIS
jgi:hypothetical protein